MKNDKIHFWEVDNIQIFNLSIMIYIFGIQKNVGTKISKIFQRLLMQHYEDFHKPEKIKFCLIQ